ncbi:MAG: M48 family metalloprotease, partial [Planctomycetota bacterium]
MEEDGINAFAAGFSPSDAVIGVTRGCAETLSRDELQGVIAHEFSHILNGDMRMSIRLIGILHGILLLGLIGQIVIRSMFYSGYSGGRRSDSKGSGNGGGILIVIAIAVALIVIGSIGSLVGGLIKAAVSRQREYLADASAVQFTRNPGGIAGALKRIGGAVFGSRLKHPRAAEASHMYFAQGVWEGFTSLMATHPPLPKRILAIEPKWDGLFPKTEAAGRVSAPTTAAAAFAGAAPSAPSPAAQPAAWSPAPPPITPPVGEVSVVVADHAADQIGEPTEDHRRYAATLLDSIDDRVKDAARDPYGARAVMYGLLIDRDVDVRAAQLAVLDKQAERGMADLTRQLLPAITSCDTRARLPIVDMALPALRALSRTQYPRFRDCFTALVKADNRLGLFEWTLSQVMIRHLRPQFERVRPPGIQYYGLQKLGDECSVLLSTLAYAGHP